MHVVTLPEGEDPGHASCAHSGARGLEAQLATSIDVFERKIQILERGGWFADLRKKRQALDRLLPTIRATSDPLTRDLYLGRASEAAGVTRELLERELTAPARSARRSRPGRPARARGRARERPAEPRGRPTPPPDVTRVRRAERRRIGRRARRRARSGS